MKKVLLLTMLIPALICTLEKEASANLPYGDINGDGTVNVVDVQLMIGLSLGIPLSPILDADGDGVADQYAANTITDCGSNTVLENGVCVVDPVWLESVQSDAFDDGVASVDITTDNQQAYDDGVASVDITIDNQGVYDDGYTAGAASVDITSDNQQAYDDGVASVDITTDNQSAYNDGFTAGVASVDITTDNQSAYNDGFSAGAASVDITVDNEVAYENGFNTGAASVDITIDNQVAFDDGVASVDITTDNQASYDAGYLAGNQDANFQCSILDEPLPVCDATNTDVMEFPGMSPGPVSVTLTREGKAGELVPIVIEVSTTSMDGAQSVSYESITLNGTTFQLYLGAVEKAGGLYGLDFQSDWLSMEGGQPEYSAVTPHVSRWTFLAEMQEGTNTLSYTRDVYLGNEEKPGRVELTFGDCAPIGGAPLCEDVSSVYLSDHMGPTSTWGDGSLTWTSEHAEIVDLKVKMTIDAPPNQYPGESLGFYLGNIQINGIPHAFNPGLSGEPLFEVGITNQPLWLGNNIVDLLLGPEAMPYHVMWEMPLAMPEGANTITWDFMDGSSLFPGATQRVEIFIDECEDNDKPLCTVDGSSDKVLIQPDGVLSKTQGSVSVDGKKGDMVDLQFLITTPDVCAEGTNEFIIDVFGIEFNGPTTNYQFFWDAIEKSKTWTYAENSWPEDLVQAEVDFTQSNSQNGYFKVHDCQGSSLWPPTTTVVFTSPVILEKDGLNTFTWNWGVQGTPGGTTPFEMEVKFSDCTTYDPSSIAATTCTGQKESITFVENSVLSGGDYQLTRQGTAGEIAMVKFTATIPECGAGMHLDFAHFQLNGVNQLGTPGLVEQTNTMSNFGMTNSSWTLDPQPYLQLIACAADPTEPAVLVWEYPVVLEDGLNTLSWSYVDQDIMPFGSAPRTFDIQFGECQDTSP